VHCLIPPHPGATAAAALLKVDAGALITYGIIVAIPVMLVGHLWAKYASRSLSIEVTPEEEPETSSAGPGAVLSFLPVIVPIMLIALKAFYSIDAAAQAPWIGNLLIIGDPVIALAIGILLAMFNLRHSKNTSLQVMLIEGAEKAGGILVIISAGGAFGAVLAATKMGTHFASALPLASMGLLFPFLLTALLKTAQGSSTVAVITAASIVAPLLPALGFGSDHARLFCVLAMGAGSMMISHANDAYFWVIARFSGLEMRSMLRVYSVATLLMGITAIIIVSLIAHFS